MTTRADLVRFAAAVAILLGSAVFLNRHRHSEVVPHPVPLASFPVRLGDWTGKEQLIGDDVLQTLGPGDFLSRSYHKNASTPPVDLFLGYFPSQKQGNTIHSPLHCLPGAGWTFVASQRIQLDIPGRARMEINRHIIAKGGARELVLYWYQGHGRTMASEYWARAYLALDSMRLNRTDQAIIRIITPLPPFESEEVAQQRARQFAQLLVPELGRYIPD